MAKAPHRKEIKSTEKLDWLQLAKYDELKSLEPMDFYKTVVYRWKLYRDCRAWPDSEIKKRFEQLKANRFIPDPMFSRVMPKRSKQQLEEMEACFPEATGAIHEVGFIDMMMCFDFFNEAPNDDNLSDVEAFQSLLTNPQHYTINVNLHEPEAKILADFKAWLKKTRAAKVGTPRRKYDIYLSSLLTHKVLPYIDILIYQEITGKKLSTASTIENIGFTEDQIKTFENDTQAKAKEILSVNYGTYLTWLKSTCEAATASP